MPSDARQGHPGHAPRPRPRHARLEALASGQYQVNFRHSPAGPARSVDLVGPFTGWKEHPLGMAGPDARGAYSATAVLGPGSHEYKFLIDGDTFRQDPGNPDSAGFFHNSLIRLP